jgi:hypothetical protein
MVFYLRKRVPFKNRSALNEEKNINGGVAIGFS